MDTSLKTCCYRPLTPSPLLAKLMVVMGGVTTAELVKRKPGLRLPFCVFKMNAFSQPLPVFSEKKSFVISFALTFLFLGLFFYHSDSVGCRPCIVSLDLLTFPNNSVNVVFSGWQDFIEIWPFLNNHQVTMHLLQETFRSLQSQMHSYWKELNPITIWIRSSHHLFCKCENLTLAYW